MDGKMLFYIIACAVISSLFSFILARVWDLVRIIRQQNNERRMRANRPLHVPGPDLRHHNIPSANYVPPVPRANPLPPPPSAAPDNRTAPAGTTNTTGRSSQPPNLPRRSGNIRMTPDAFPKCPVCRCRNKVGQSQVVFWDRERKNWRCHNGHRFNS